VLRVSVSCSEDYGMEKLRCDFDKETLIWDYQNTLTAQNSASPLC
jgi:hypothetical protein